MVKDEDQKPKLESELNEEETRKMEALHRALNKKKPWPTDAKLVHIDGTSCSQTCMKNPHSKYHSDTILELQAATPNTSQNNVEITDSRIHRTMSLTTDMENNNNQGSNNNNVELEVATDRSD